MSDNIEKKISDEALEQVAGGMIYYNEDQTDPNRDPSRPWEVINNNNGSVLARYSHQWEACEFAKKYGKDPYNTMMISKEIKENLIANPHTN
jgi:hypothetical protein